jgi:hypothetical protein
MLKSQITSSKSQISSNYQNSNTQTGKYGLEERTYQFAHGVALFCKKLPYTPINTNYINQLLRASSSVGANYIEANESLGKKDFLRYYFDGYLKTNFGDLVFQNWNLFGICYLRFGIYYEESNFRSLDLSLNLS